MDFIVNLLIFLVALSILVMIHEFGHLLFAKIFGVFCYEYSIGMGPRLFSKKIGETYYSIKLFPIGGSVIMAGEEIDEDTKKSLGPIFDVEVPLERTLHKITNWKKLFVIGGGALFNLILGFILVFVVSSVQGIARDSGKIIVDSDSLIYAAGLRTDDKIYDLEIKIIEGTEVTICSQVGNNFTTNQEVYDKLQECQMTKNGQKQETYFHYTRGSGNYKSSLITRTCNDDTCSTTSKFGFSGKSEYQKVKGAEIITNPLRVFGDYSIAIFKGLASLFTPSGINNVSGPVGIFKLSEQVASNGFFVYLSFMALLSINLGIFNLIPFPGLDGSTIFITAGEMVTRRELSSKTKAYINYFGFFFLIALIILVTIKDIIG